MKMKVVILSLLLISLLATACGGSASTRPERGLLPSSPPQDWRPAVGQTALDFEAVTLDGQTVRLSDYVGQGPVLLNFMHTWCVPCNRSAPHMVRVYEAHESEGFTIVSVSVDEPVQAGQDFVARYGIQYPFLRDPRSSAFRKYALAGMPTSLMLDKEGTIRAIWPGELTEAQIEQGLAQFAMVQR